MTVSRWSPAEKAEALRLYAEHGMAAAHKATGIPKSTIGTWAREQGVRTFGGEKTAAAVEAKKLTMEQRRLAFAEGLMDDLERMRAQLFAPAVVHHFDKDGAFHQADLAQPTFADQQRIWTSIGIGTEKVLLLTGEATQRTETVDPRREAAKVADELAARREQRRTA